jgi:hypothetical protein
MTSKTATTHNVLCSLPAGAQLPEADDRQTMQKKLQQKCGSFTAFPLSTASFKPSVKDDDQQN